jgi:hypothetical protein
MFTKAMQKEDGVDVHGNVCNICQYVLGFNINLFNLMYPFYSRAKGLHDEACFFRGGNSSLRKHISRYVSLSLFIYPSSDLFYRNFTTHGKVYLEKCNEVGMEPVAAALPQQSQNSASLQDSQVNLDGFVKSVPKWSKEGLLEHIIDLVVSDDQVGFNFLFDDMFG